MKDNCIYDDDCFQGLWFLNPENFEKKKKAELKTELDNMEPLSDEQLVKWCLNNMEALGNQKLKEWCEKELKEFDSIKKNIPLTKLKQMQSAYRINAKGKVESEEIKEIAKRKEKLIAIANAGLDGSDRITEKDFEDFLSVMRSISADIGIKPSDVTEKLNLLRSRKTAELKKIISRESIINLYACIFNYILENSEEKKLGFNAIFERLQTGKEIGSGESKMYFSDSSLIYDKGKNYFLGLDDILDKCRYSKLTTKNIYDLSIAFASYAYLNFS